MLNTAQEIIKKCNDENIHFYDLVLEDQTKSLKISEEEMKSRLREILNVMKKSSQNTL